MGNIYKRIYKGKIFYYSNIYHGNKRIRKSLRRNKKEALNKLNQLEFDLNYSIEKLKEKSIEEGINQYNKFLALTGISLRQIKDITSKLNYFKKHCLSLGITKLNKVSKESSYQYIVNRFNSGISNTTLNREIGFIKRFFKYCITNDWIDSNPFTGHRIAIKRTFKQRYSFSEIEIKTILDKADKYHDIFTFLLETGLRPTDTFKLKPKNIIDNYLKLRMNKTGDFLNIPLPNSSLIKLKPRMEFEYIFPEVRTPWQRKLCLRNLKQNFTIEMIRKNNINLHTFRHTYAHNMLNKGVPKEVLQTLLGHRSVKTTEIYANWVRKEELEKWV